MCAACSCSRFLEPPQVMEFGRGSQSKEIRENLSKFKKFLEHFCLSKWLGDLIAPEFVQQQKLAVKILNGLQTKTQLSLPGCGMKPEKKPAVGCLCQYCQETTVSGGLCINCKMCVHGYNYEHPPFCCLMGCSKSTNANASAKTDQTDKTISVSPKGPSSFYEGLSSCGSGSSDKLESLAKMSEALAKAFREDVETRKAAEKVRGLVLKRVLEWMAIDLFFGNQSHKSISNERQICSLGCSKTC